MGEVFRGVKPRDWLLAGALTLLGAVLMVENVIADDAGVAREVARGAMEHPLDSHSWWMLPVFAAATVPVLWWRRSALAVTAVALAALVAHDLLFGWVTRCGAGLPLAFVLGFLGALDYRRTKAWVCCFLSAL